KIHDFLVHCLLRLPTMSAAKVISSSPSRSTRREHDGLGSGAFAAPRRYHHSAASAVPPAGTCLELCRSTLRPRERISLTSTLKLSGIPASKVSSPRTIASYTLVRPATSSDFTVSISCKVYAAP